MDERIRLSATLDLEVINSLSFGKADGPRRDLVRAAYKGVQLPVLKAFGEKLKDKNYVKDKGLRPVDSIGSTREPGVLTDSSDPQPGYHHLYLIGYSTVVDDAAFANVDGGDIAERFGAGKPIGLRVTDEFKAPSFGHVLMEYFTAMVNSRPNDVYAVDLSKLSDGESGTALLKPREILISFTKHLSKSPGEFRATLSDGVGIEAKILAEMGYERFGPEGQTMLWTPPLNAEKKEQYEVAIPMELYVRFGSGVSDHRFPEKAALFIAIDKYIKEGGTELNPRRLKKAGYVFDTLPAVTKTREALRSVAAANGGYVPCSPISLAQK